MELYRSRKKMQVFYKKKKGVEINLDGIWSKNAYKLFWFRLFKFIEVRLKRNNINKFNLIIYGRLLYKYKHFFKAKKVTAKLNHFFYKTGVSHNGCKLKKKKT